jgi:hypothetical protein
MSAWRSEAGVLVCGSVDVGVVVGVTGVRVAVGVAGVGVNVGVSVGVPAGLADDVPLEIDRISRIT